jgi:ketosteroid isomerase-like protein
MTDDARAVMESHHRAVNAGSLEGVMANIADDVVAAVPGTPLIKGKDSFRAFFSGLLRLGTWTHAYEIQDLTAVGESVVMSGLSSGTLTPPGGTAGPWANSFILTFRYGPDGKMRFWRVAFAPQQA